MKEAIDQFRTQVAAAIDSVQFAKIALDRQVYETDQRDRYRMMLTSVHEIRLLSALAAGSYLGSLGDAQLRMRISQRAKQLKIVRTDHVCAPLRMGFPQ